MDGIETIGNQRANGDPFQMETSWIKENHTRWIEPTEWMGETSMGNLAANESKENLDNLGTRYGTWENSLPPWTAEKSRMRKMQRMTRNNRLTR